MRLSRLRDRSKAAGVCAAEVMTKPAVTIGGDAPVTEAARLMRLRKVKRLPVVDDDGRLRGIVTRTDLLAVFERPDDEIRAEVMNDIIGAEFGLDQERVAVIVRFGVVTVAGSVPSGAVAFRILDAIKHLEGVVGVRNRISYPEKI
jgi:CBS-domain-containing membrane protein